jgi:hypothetical protein
MDGVMTVARWTGLEARALREALRMSVRAFAAHLGVAIASVSNWERRGQRIRLRDETQHILDTALHRASDNERARFEAAIADTHALASGEAGRLRHVLASPVRLDMVTVAHLRDRVASLDAEYHLVPSATLLGAAGQLHGKITLLAANSGGARTDRDLHLALAESATLIGQLVWDASMRRDHHAATTYFDLAWTAAERAGDSLAAARARLRHSYVAFYGQKDPASGHALAEYAATTSRGTSDALAGLALLHVAEAHAMRGQRRECEGALVAAERCLATTDPAAAEFVAPTDLNRMAGSCYLFLGDAPRAAAYLSDTLAASPQATKAAAVTAANLALAYSHMGRADEAVDSLHRAVDIIDETRGGAGLNVAFAAARGLRRWRGTTAVDEIHDRLFTLMAG